MNHENNHPIPNDNIKEYDSSWSSTMLTIFSRLLQISSGLIAIFIAILYIKQESLLYFPSVGGIPRRPSQNPKGYRSPAEYNIPFESHSITTADGIKIHAWLLLHPDSLQNKIPTILFFHGNAGNIGLRLPNANQMYHHLKANIVLVEYRGYGDSDDAKITEKGLQLDAEAAWDFFRSHSQIDPSRIFVFGRSLGGAVAFHLVRYVERLVEQHSSITSLTSSLTSLSIIHPLMGVMVENTFLSIGHMVNALMPFIAPLKFLILRMDWNNEKHAHEIVTPVLFLAGDRDELVPHHHMQRLHQLSSIKSRFAKLHIIRGGTHNDSWVKGGMDYFLQMREFMSQIMRRQDGVSSPLSVKSSTIAATGARTPNNSVRCIADSDDGVMDVDMMGEDANAGAIPMMPKNLLSMAKEATGSSVKAMASTKQMTNKKEE
jgi:pimeloyl-ACP methyl ester carboxylesterase